MQWNRILTHYTHHAGMAAQPSDLGERPMATNKHGTISAAEAREIVQAVRAGVGEG